MDFFKPIISSVGPTISYLALNQPKNFFLRGVTNIARTVYIANVISGFYAALHLANTLVNSDKSSNSKFSDRLAIRAVVILLVGGLSLIPGFGFCAVIYVHGNAIIHKLDKWQKNLLK